MKIDTHPKFDRHVAKRIQKNRKLSLQVAKRLRLFAKDPSNALLRNHSLSGNMKGLHSFSITGDIRVIYKKITENHVLLLDIGSHNQVY